MLDTGDCAVEEESVPVTKRGEWEVTYMMIHGDVFCPLYRGGG